MAKVKNDPTKYVKREVSAPKYEGAPKRVDPGGNSDKRFFTAPISAGGYLDLRPRKQDNRKR